MQSPRDFADPLQRILDAQGFVVLDGGLATTLQAEGYALDTPLWSAELLAREPAAARRAHRSFLEAGADCVTSASYQASLPGFASAGLEDEEGARLLACSVQIAVEARDAFWGDPKHRSGRLEPLVAASVGPYGAFLADGSEYDGRYGVGSRVLAEFHRPRLGILTASAPDVLAIETIPSAEETQVLIDILADVAHPGAWISFSCRDGGHLWDGTPIEAAVSVCRPEAGVVAVGVNCTAPRFVGELVGRMRDSTELPILAYPNSGESFDPTARVWSGDAAGASWVDEALGWLRDGAVGIGGCCRVGPDVIRMLRRRLTETAVG